MSDQTHTASPEPDLWEVSLATFPMLPVLHDVNPLLDRIDELTAVLDANPLVNPVARVIPMQWRQMRDGAGELVDVWCAWCPVFQKHFYAEREDRIPKVEARRAARILTAIEIVEDKA